MEVLIGTLYGDSYESNNLIERVIIELRKVLICCARGSNSDRVRQVTVGFFFNGTVQSWPTANRHVTWTHKAQRFFVKTDLTRAKNLPEIERAHLIKAAVADSLSSVLEVLKQREWMVDYEALHSALICFQGRIKLDATADAPSELGGESGPIHG